MTAIKARYGLPVMKGRGHCGCQRSATRLTLMHRWPIRSLWMPSRQKDADLPGGNGLSFDWRLIAGRRWPVPWMLAGGLTPDNVAEAVRLTGARQVDVSSGVESAPGIKDTALIRAFVTAANAP